MLILLENTDIFSFFLIKDTTNTHNLNNSISLKIIFQFSREIANCSEFSWKKNKTKKKIM